MLFGLIALAAAADDWRPDYSLRPRPDGPGVDSLVTPPPPDDSLFPGPAADEDPAVWRARWTAWAEARRKSLQFKDDRYRDPALAWTRHSVVQDQLLVWDRSFYDPGRHAYTVEAALDAVETRFGPLDSVLIWPGYPMVGLDERNQFDLIRDLPGGLPALRQAIADFHRHGVKVLLPMVIWDLGTRDEGMSASRAMVRLVRDLGADGINFDTLDEIPADAVAEGAGLALEPQFDPQNPTLAASVISWNDWVVWDQPAPVAPRVSKVKWLEPRHMVLVTDRYARNKINSLQQAFFNGQGYALIENMWGFWNPFAPRDAEAIRRFARIERAFADLLASPAWQPHSPALQSGIFASVFPGAGQTLWTLVNRNEYAVNGSQLAIPVHPGARYFDLWHGRDLTPVLARGEAVLTFPMEGLGFGAVLEDRRGGEDPALHIMLAAAAADRPLANFASASPVERQAMTAMKATQAASEAPAGMIEIPAGPYDFRVSGIEVENGNDPGVDVQFPWEEEPRRTHRHLLQMARFFIDRTPVTNRQFKIFLDQSGYHPDDDHNFLRDWQAGSYPPGWDDKPVTWVALEDARAYAAWAGKRLPHVWEWQYAAQGGDGRTYPWGSVWQADRLPAKDRGRVRRPPSDVGAYPGGASPFGVLDMVGNVGQWTDEFSDSHTRAAVIRGGDYYRPQGSLWYFPKSDRLDEQEKTLLMAPSRDRSGVVGFRCVMDAAAP